MTHDERCEIIKTTYSRWYIGTLTTLELSRVIQSLIDLRDLAEEREQIIERGKA